nr:acyltransferase family protein [Sphingomonas chungangi]
MARQSAHHDGGDRERAFGVSAATAGVRHVTAGDGRAATHPYFPGIDGLRALAVLGVVLFHVHESWMPGGFVGVDVFFVISGYVVAQSVSEANPSSLSDYFIWFYRRRFARIFPALFLYVIVVEILGMLFIPGGRETQYIAMTGTSSLFGLSNVVLFFKSGDYFSPGTAFNTFTHTWSLAVEEQYYFIFPFFSYWLIARRSAGKSKIALAVLVAATLGSLLACWLVTRRSHEFAFYMLPTRFWELGIGFLLKLALSRERRAISGGRGMAVVGAVGFVVLIASFVLTPSDPFPFPFAIPACLGTAAVIACIVTMPTHWANVLLTREWLRHVGRISYSLYLWHWGVVVLLRWTVGLDTSVLRVIAFAATFALAEASYHWVERPIRSAAWLKTISAPRYFATFGGVAALLAVSCTALDGAKPTLGLAASNDVTVWDAYAWPGAASAQCANQKRSVHFGGGQLTTWSPACAPAAPAGLFVLGDSHAGAYTRMLWQVAASGRYDVRLYSLGGCRPIQTLANTTIPACDAFLNRSIADIRARARPGDVIFLPALAVPRVRDGDGSLRTPEGPVGAQDRQRNRVRLGQLLSTGARVIIEEPKPVTAVELVRCADPFNRISDYCRIGPDLPRSMLEKRAAPARALYAALAQPGVYYWDPFPALCDTPECHGYLDGRPLYSDTDHLSGFANDLLLPNFLQFVDRVRADTGTGPLDQTANAQHGVVTK